MKLRSNKIIYNLYDSQTLSESSHLGDTSFEDETETNTDIETDIETENYSTSDIDTGNDNNNHNYYEKINYKKNSNNIDEYVESDSTTSCDENFISINELTNLKKDQDTDIDTLVNAMKVNSIRRRPRKGINEKYRFSNNLIEENDNDTENELNYDNEIEKDDMDYIPNFKNDRYESSKQDKEFKSIYKYFKFTEEDKRYFKSLDTINQNEIAQIKDTINKKYSMNKPLIFKILECKLPLESKIEIVKKYKESKIMEKSSSEYYKLQEYIDGILNIPFDKYNALNFNKLNIDTAEYIINTKKNLDNIIFGHDKVKMHILEILAQYISAPKSIGNVFGIYGPMGIGKTTIIKDGLSQALTRPFNFITLGGASDASFLDGHSYTYEGSRYGKIVECLIKSKCMNPIFYFDELDKVSKTAKGEEITNLLIHLTDESQNYRFQDKYYTGIDINLSRAIFVFSFNHIDQINPILRDRLNIIKLEGFNIEEKFVISKDYLIKNIIKEFDAYNIQFSSECLRYIITEFSDEQGVRELKRKIKDIVSRINLITLTKGRLLKNIYPSLKIINNSCLNQSLNIINDTLSSKESDKIVIDIEMAKTLLN